MWVFIVLNWLNNTSNWIIKILKGLVWPAISDIFIRWVPLAEKSRLIGFASAGNNLGNIVALLLGTYLCVDGFAGGWPSIFYIYGKHHFNLK